MSDQRSLFVLEGDGTVLSRLSGEEGPEPGESLIVEISSWGLKAEEAAQLIEGVYGVLVGGEERFKGTLNRGSAAQESLEIIRMKEGRCLLLRESNKEQFSHRNWEFTDTHLDPFLELEVLRSSGEQENFSFLIRSGNRKSSRLLRHPVERVLGHSLREEMPELMASQAYFFLVDCWRWQFSKEETFLISKRPNRWIRLRASASNDRILLSLREVTKEYELLRELERSVARQVSQQFSEQMLHDIRNRLLPIMITADLQQTHADPNVAADMAMISERSRKIASLAEWLLGLSQPKGLDQQAIQVNNTLSEIEETFNKFLRPKQISFSLKLDPELPYTMGCSGQIEHIVSNLLLNSIRAMPNGGHLEISTQFEEEQIIIRVQDDGQGMDKETHAQALTPGFTTQPGASGMGLSSVASNVQSLGGQLEIESRLSWGTLVQISLPPISLELEPLSEQGRILVIDDDEMVRRLIRRALERSGFEVEEAVDFHSALKICQRSSLQLLLVDVILASENGPEVVGKLLEKYNFPVLYMSGHSRDTLLNYGFKKDLGLLEKPFRIETLIKSVQRAIHK